MGIENSRYSVHPEAAHTHWHVPLSWVTRVTRVGIVAGVGPLEATGMPESQLISGPSHLRILRKLQWRLAARAVRTDKADTVIDRTVTTMTGADCDAMRRPEVRAWYRTMFTEAFAQGATAATYEGELYRQAWGFDPANITTETNLWHGTADHWVPLTTARWLADQIPQLPPDRMARPRPLLVG